MTTLMDSMHWSSQGSIKGSEEWECLFLPTKLGLWALWFCGCESYELPTSVLRLQVPETSKGVMGLISVDILWKSWHYWNHFSWLYFILALLQSRPTPSPPWRGSSFSACLRRWGRASWAIVFPGPIAYHLEDFGSHHYQNQPRNMWSRKCFWRSIIQKCSSWWFQPIWKICASQNGFIFFPKDRGENKNIFETAT